MDQILITVAGICAHSFIDDVLVYSATPEQHLLDLRKILDIFRDAGLTANVEKCKLMQRSVRYIGLIVNDEGIHINPKNVDAIMK